METIQDFLTDNRASIKSDIIDKLPEIFDSHDFIEKFKKRFEKEYISFFEPYEKNLNRTVNSQIASFLNNYQDEFNIAKDGIVKSENVFGNHTSNQNWHKL